MRANGDLFDFLFVVWAFALAGLVTACVANPQNDGKIFAASFLAASLLPVATAEVRRKKNGD